MLGCAAAVAPILVIPLNPPCLLHPSFPPTPPLASHSFIQHRANTELAIGNIVRRVLHMIREEEQQEQLGQSEGGTAGGGDAADQQAGVSQGGRE